MQPDRIHDQRRIKLLLLACIALKPIFHVVSRRGLFADGSHFLLQMLERKSFFTDDQPRLFSQTLLQIPPVLALALGTRNIDHLILWQSFGLFFLPSFFWILALKNLIEDELFWPFFLLFSAVNFNLLFFAVGEFNLCYSLVAYVMSILLGSKPIDKTKTFFLIVSMICLTKTYEAMVFLGPLVTFASVLRLKKLPVAREKGVLYFSAIFGMVAMLLSAWSIAFPRCASCRNGAAAVDVIKENTQLAVTLFSTTFVLLASYIRLKKYFATILYLSSTLFALLLLDRATWASPAQQFSSRAIVGILLFFTMLFLALKKYPPNLLTNILHGSRLGRFSYLPTFACLFFLVLSFSNIIQTLEFRAYLKYFEKEIESHSGQVPFENTLLGQQPYLKFNWPWSNPALSLILRKNPNGAIIRNSNSYQGWEPYAPNAEPTSGYYKE